MLLFVKRLRRNLLENQQLKKYTVYAAGEMVLVVLGILIALQINNWNSEKQQREKLRNYLDIIAKNIAGDLISINALLSARVSAYEVSLQWQNFSDRDGSLSLSEVAYANRALSEASMLHHFNANTSGYEALKNSGTFEQISGSDIESLLYDYYDTVSQIVLKERDHNEYVRLIWLQVLADWPAELEQWELAVPEVLTVERFQQLQSIFMEMLEDAIIKTMFATPRSIRPILIDYKKLEYQGRALRRMIDAGIMDFDDDVAALLSGIHDQRSGIGDPTVIADGQVSWESYFMINADANDPRISRQASNLNRKSPFSFRTLERAGNSLHIDYLGGVEWAGIWFRPGSTEFIVPQDYTVYEKLVLELKGDAGGETIHVNIEDRDDPRDGTSTKVPLLLTDQWQTYEVDLSEFKTADLEILTTPFGFVFYMEPVAFSVRNVRYMRPD